MEERGGRDGRETEMGARSRWEGCWRSGFASVCSLQASPVPPLAKRPNGEGCSRDGEEVHTASTVRYVPALSVIAYCMIVLYQSIPLKT
eukprot:305004-Rhodomonas_salina.5